MTRDERDRPRKPPTGYAEPGVDPEDTGVITPGNAYWPDGSVADPQRRGPPGENVEGAPPSEPKAPSRSIDREDAMRIVRGKREDEDG